MTRQNNVICCCWKNNALILAEKMLWYLSTNWTYGAINVAPQWLVACHKDKLWLHEQVYWLRRKFMFSYTGWANAKHTIVVSPPSFKLLFPQAEKNWWKYIHLSKSSINWHSLFISVKLYKQQWPINAFESQIFQFLAEWVCFKQPSRPRWF